MLRFLQEYACDDRFMTPKMKSLCVSDGKKTTSVFKQQTHSWINSGCVLKGALTIVNPIFAVAHIDGTINELVFYTALDSVRFLRLGTPIMNHKY